MGWIDKKVEHAYCTKPSTAGVGVGSIWQCDVCRQYWLFAGTTHGQYRESTGSYEEVWEKTSAPFMERPEFGHGFIKADETPKYTINPSGTGPGYYDN